MSFTGYHSCVSVHKVWKTTRVYSSVCTESYYTRRVDIFSIYTSDVYEGSGVHRTNASERVLFFARSISMITIT